MEIKAISFCIYSATDSHRPVRLWRMNADRFKYKEITDIILRSPKIPFSVIPAKAGIQKKFKSRAAQALAPRERKVK
ncbi:MAG: hypothetical protein L6302_07120 [Desulfobacteraceae bacterium]|nr:hypothetical protein [Desulfobacteraceae bacterium]